MGEIRIGSVTITGGCADADVVVVEEDTWLVLGAPSEVPGTENHPIRVMTGAHDAEPLEPGTVVVREGLPPRLLAVVHDVSREPSWREEWVALALRGVLDRAAARRARSIGLPVLGAVHGSMRPDRFAWLLQAAIRDGTGTVTEIRLTDPPALRRSVLEALRDGSVRPR